MARKSCCCFICFSCFSAKRLSPSASECPTPLCAEGPFPSAILNDGHNRVASSSIAVVCEEHGSRPPTDYPSLPSTSQPRPPTAADYMFPEWGSSHPVAYHDEQVGLPSASSSSETVSNLIKAIREDAETVNVNLDALMDDIAGLLEAIKTQKGPRKKTQSPKDSQKKTEWPISARLLKLNKLLLETMNGIGSSKDALPAHEASKVARNVVQGLGQAHWVASGFLLVSCILDRFETLSSNQDGCLSLLEQMYDLAVDINKLTGWEDLAQAGTELIVEGFLICGSYFPGFSSTSINEEDLFRFEERFQEFHKGIILQMPMWISSRILCQKVRPPQPREQAYPHHAVGIEEPLNRVIKLLQWESEERAVAVIVHGFGGVGKTTLAGAVFARYYVKDCKYSVVRLNSSPDIVKLQKNILEDLMGGTEEGRTFQGTKGDGILDLDLDSYIDGRREIGKILQKEVAFIYIDDVVENDSIEQFLPSRELKDAKKLRLLITTRNRNVLNRLCYIKREVHEMQALSPDQGKSLLSKEMCNGPDDINMQITGSEWDKIVEISGGVPKLLKMMARYILLSEPGKIRESYDRVIEESKNLRGDAFNHIDSYIFAYDHLPEECKSPFLDICCFFKGWEWETVANIVGESQLDMLEKRALVSKDRDMISVHDAILTIGKAKAQDTRFDFTKATASEIEEFFEQEMESLEMVTGLWFSDQECNIPVTKLNSMHNSLRVFGHKMVLEEGQCEKIFHELLVYKGETPHFPFKWSCLKKLRFLSHRPQKLTLLQEIPSSNLKHIELDGSLCSVREISFIDIQQLRALQVLRLINFEELTNLPGNWGDYLRENLKELTLSHCTAMKQLTGSISQLTSLEILKLDYCYNLRRWPKDCESLSSSLRKLNMWKCPSLKSLPRCFGDALDSDSRLLFQHKGILLDYPQSESDSDYESDED